jgi:rod shape-determining protein MreC
MALIAGFQIRAPSNVARFLFFALLSLALLYVDSHGQHLKRIREGLTVLFAPIQYMAALPGRVGTGIANFFTGEENLRKELERLRTERPLLIARMEKYNALESENAHLRALLGTGLLVADKAEAAELLEVASEPFRRTIIIAKGGKDNLYVGQPVIDTYGIRGQVNDVGVLQSTAILITDPGHAIPVIVRRNGLRAIAFGTGASDSVSIRYLTASADIKEGDELVSSGLGGTFPFGYPVGKVTKIVNNPNESFLDIAAVPAARLNHGREVLLIWPSKSIQPPEIKKPETAKKPAEAKKPAPVVAPKPAPAPAPAATPAPATSPVAPTVPASDNAPKPTEGTP